MRWAMMRAYGSRAPPGGVPTMNRMVPVLESAACAKPADKPNAKAMTAAAARIRRMLSSLLGAFARFCPLFPFRGFGSWQRAKGQL
jgi:hypothetical protein